MNIDRSFGKKGTLLFANQNWVTEFSPKIWGFQNDLYLFYGIKKSFDDSRIVIVKMNNLGQLDKQYFDNGYKYTDINLTKGIDSFNFLKVTIQFLPTIHDQILMCSSMSKKDSTSRRVLLCIKIGFNGEVDSTFGNNGKLWIDNEDLVLGSKCILDSTGNIYVSKLEQVKSNNAYFVKLEKYLSNGKQDFTYGINGKTEFGVKSTSNPMLAIDSFSKLYISYTEDSIINIKSFESNGQPNFLFGINGAIKYANFINNRIEIAKDMIIHDQYIYIEYLSQGLNSEDEWGTIKIDNHGYLIKDFADKGFLKITNYIDPITNIYTSFIGDYIVSAGSSKVNGGQLLSTVYTQDGTFTSNLNEKWILNYDSLKFQPYAFSYNVLNDKLFVLGSYSDASIVPINLVILNLFLDKTTKTESSNLKDNITLFPNPVKKEINITLSNNLTQITAVELLNIFGQVVIANNIKYGDMHCRINVENTKPGVYLLKLRNNKRFIGSAKLIIE